MLQVPSWLAYQPSVFGINAYKFSGGSVSTYPDNTTLIKILTGVVDTVTQYLDLYGPENINSISNLANYLGNEAAARRLTTASQHAALVANPNQSLI